VKLGLSEQRARNHIGRSLKTNKPEEILRAIEQAERNGTRDPIPYVTEMLKPKDLGWRKNGGGYLVKYGSEPLERMASALQAGQRPPTMGLFGEALVRGSGSQFGRRKRPARAGKKESLRDGHTEAARD
jgi:hypothetical protein